MQFFENRMICKSNEENFLKEKSGIKNNTIREVELGEYNNLKTFERELSNRMNQKFIIIQNSVTGEMFEREICDITLFKQWNEAKESEKQEEGGKTRFDTIRKYIFIISFKGENKCGAYVDIDEELMNEVPRFQDIMKRRV